MRSVVELVRLVAPTEAPVLIEGESGTGKELVARALHELSGRCDRPFVAENCAACPDGLLEGEFFGTEAGAYTGAVRSRPGVFERAAGGTLFLDEIGELDLSMQAKLLRVLQERRVRRLGGSEPVPVRFRLVTATNRRLREEEKLGRFRLDLRYRLDVVRIEVPPLRTRPEDIPALVRTILRRFAGSAQDEPQLAPEAMSALVAHDWPGNVRELENELRRLLALAIEPIELEHLSAPIQRTARRAGAAKLFPETLDLEEIERDVSGSVLRLALASCGGNCAEAARRLGLPKTTLYRRLQRYSISRKRPLANGQEAIARALARLRFLELAAQELARPETREEPPPEPAAPGSADRRTAT